MRRLFFLVLLAACQSGDVTERGLRLTGEAECTSDRLTLLQSVAVAAVATDPDGDPCLFEANCVDVSNVDSAAELEASIAAEPQPLLDLPAGDSFLIAIAGYTQDGCPTASDVRVCGSTTLVPGETTDLAIQLQCEVLAASIKCLTYRAPLPCP